MEVMKRGILCLPLLAALTSCVDIDVRTKIEAGGGGVQNWQFTTTALLAGKIREQVERDPFFRKKNAKISEQFKEGDFILSVEIPFEEARELNGDDRKVSFESSGLLRRHYKYSETWKRDMNEQARLLWRDAGNFVPVTLRVSVEMPAKIVDSDADVVEGNVAKWTIPFSDLAESKTLRVEAARWNLWVIGPAALGALLIVIGIGVVAGSLSRKNSKQPLPVAKCSACGAGIPAGSKFCNACGAQL